MCALPNFSDSLFENNHCELTTPEIADSEINNKSILTDNLKQLRDANHKKCLIASLNVNSLPNKFVEIKEWLRCGVFDILSIQETKIDKTFPNSQFYVEGFKYFRRDRKKGGGGIIVYIKENIIAQQKKIACKQLETILLQLRIGQRQFALISAYKPPSVDNNAFTTELSMVLDEAFLLSENIVCTGDLNSDLLQPLSNNKQGKCLLDICDIYDLDSLINKPTRVSENRSSCLDVILTNVPAFMGDSDVVETGLSDHYLVYTVLNIKPMRPKSEPLIKRSLKNFNQKAFLEDLSKVPFSTAYIFDDSDDVYWCWETLYNQVLDDHAPIRKFYRRPRIASKFITAETRNAMKERDRLKKKYYKSRNPTDWEQYRQIRNKVVSMRRKSVQEHFRKLCVDKHGNQKKFWSTIKPYINSRKIKTNSRIVIKDNQKIITDTKEVVETLNKYFSGDAYVPDSDHANAMPDLRGCLPKNRPTSFNAKNDFLLYFVHELCLP
jgi:hypothetical protein